ncbi:small ribosomal subunit Rsm22 family protein [Bradyrhizobium aeschynomenes]|uniref:small ribosomal subunit Rsm22 family protein n=1 Tax=Bradyrhizobium aeschynomenes TaxID=2734909 RepID=UPI0015537E3D|nr:small ribosomal subunit Rsm22 family protein [Bradyrhizobium aeschynomenes]NPV23614.1 SAM-dependent methyltransferase [Bradyrhizobium aeschynomenes]
MISPDLPAALKASLEARLHGLSRQDAAARATRISDTYRSGGNSGAITTEADAIAYATVRMPATYAAVAASLNALMQASPDFAPSSLLDVGAGPGTASFAAAEAFSSLTSFNAIDANHALRTLALSLAADGLHSRDLTYALGGARALLDRAERAGLVIASYMINELSDAERRSVVDLLWEKTDQTLLIVEPGTPAGYQRIIAARDQLIAKRAHVAAPCPHAAACPLIAPDWCHFVQRLARSRAHRELKGADVPFEDEKFSFIALTRHPVSQRPTGRVLAAPVVTKVGATAKLCRADGTAAVVSIPRRDKPAFAAARRWDWGDGVELPPRP